MKERTVSSTLSGDVIDLLLKRGMTPGAIAKAMGVTRSFVSRVKARSRSLTVDHLMALETAVGEPLPLLLLEATPIDSVPAHLRPLYRSTRRVITEGQPASKSTSRPRRKVA